MKPVLSFLLKKEQIRKILFSMFIIGILFLLTFVTAFQNYEKQPIYSEVRIFINSQEQFKYLNRMGLHIDEAKKEKNAIVTVLNEDAMKILEQSDVAYEILVDDVVAEFNSRPKLSKSEMASLEMQMKKTYGIEGFGFGSKAGFYTYPEIITKLDSMHIQYPALTTVKQSIGTTIEGRSIYALKISSNPDVNDTTKPEVLYTAMLHAREPQAMMTVMYYMFYLLENYGTNDEVTYLLDHRQMWFIPCCNPDGYEYNAAGGMHRKNKRITGASNMGIDINRNFGIWRYWNAPNGGSSDYMEDDDYRGTGAFSEPETQAIRDFCNQHQFRTALNYHTYSNLLIYPWAWIDPQPTPDSAYFNYYSNTMVQWNGYEPGTASTTVGYSVRGGSDDWMYGDTTGLHPKILAMTPEVGSTGFWPSQSEIFPLAQENLKPNLFYSLVAGPYAEIRDTFFNHPAYLPGDSGLYTMIIQNIGVESVAGFEYKFSSESPYVTIPNDSGTWAMSSFRQKDTAQIQFYLNESIPAGNNISCTLKFYQNGILQKSIPIVIKINQANILTSAPDTLKFTIVQSAGDSLDEMSFYLKNTGMGTLNYSMNGSTMLMDKIVTRNIGSESNTEDKNTNPSGNGVRQTEGSGGPDAYGYKWKDSDAPGGPVYSFIDISTTGTQISFSETDDAYTTIPLPFPVKFYGTTYSGNITVSTNGWIGFGSYNSSHISNAAIPNSSTPNNIVAMLWDDLNGDNAGSKVYYGTVGNKFIIQYKNWNFYKSGVNTGGDLNFEVILTQNSDKAEIQYGTMNPGTMTFTSNTIGIENSSGSIGLQCVYNAAYVHSNMAIRFSRLPEWLSVTPSSGSINPNDSVLITAKASSQGFEDFGIFYGSVVIQSNDLLHNPLTLPAVLKYQSTVSAGDPGRSVPHVFALKQNYPNPFNPFTTISFELPSNGKVELAVYNTLGQKVRTLLTGYQTAGLKTAIWDGKNDQGKAVGSGIYLYRLTSGSFTQTRKMMMLK